MNLSQYIDSIKNKDIAVIGIGVSNQPLIKRLLEDGCRVTARDLSAREKLGNPASELENLGARLILGEGYLDELSEDIIFRTPGLRHDLPQLLTAKKRGAIITSEMELFFDICPCRIIAVTGSDGKTTTTSIISELLRAEGHTVHVGGNIGKPLLCTSDSMSQGDFAVVELSSFQLMTMKKSPDIAVVTNIAPNHLDVHLNMDEYVAAKKNICLYQDSKGIAVLNADNAAAAAFINECAGEIRLFSRRKSVDNGYFLEDSGICSAKKGLVSKILDTSEIKIPGNHNIENYMAAFAATEDFVTHKTMRKVAAFFGGVEHRIELVRELRGVRYYNDSIASSPSRTAAGLNSFDRRVILIAGGKDKGVPFDELGELICKRVKTLVLTGFTAEKIRLAVINSPGYDGTLPIYVEDGFADAVLRASEAAAEGDIVILSPACTSFDRFKNFAERGNLFKDIVNGLE